MTEVAETTGPRQSRLGKRPIPVPKSVKVELTPVRVAVQGPKGSLAFALPERVRVRLEGELLHVTSDAEGSDAPRLQGLTRALVNNMVQGVATGYERILELHGTGYRAELKGRVLTLSLGLSHQVVFTVPEGVGCVIPGDSKGTVIVLTSADKAVLGQVCATIRGFRPPEPYGGKGVRYRGERIRTKAGKAGKGRK